LAKKPKSRPHNSDERLKALKEGKSAPADPREADDFLIERLEARITRLESDLHQIYRSLGQHDAKIEILEKHGDHE
jgi:hypothetical protein